MDVCGFFSFHSAGKQLFISHFDPNIFDFFGLNFFAYLKLSLDADTKTAADASTLLFQPCVGPCCHFNQTKSCI